MKISKVLRAMVVLSFIVVTANAQTRGANSILIRAGKLYDSDKRVFVEKQEILILNGLIAKVGTKISMPKGIPLLT